MNEKDEKKLDELNKNVELALKIRTEWLDKKMEEYSKFKVGDIIYNLDTGRRLGEVIELYRYHKNEPFYDKNLSINYRYLTCDCGCDNTSRQPYVHFGTKKDLEEHLKYKLELLRNK